MQLIKQHSKKKKHRRRGSLKLTKKVKNEIQVLTAASMKMTVFWDMITLAMEAVSAPETSV
jgi:hypothetical protein